MSDAMVADFPVIRPMTTRWSDNDMFGHLNNSVYYELFDTAINGWLAEVVGVDPTAEALVPLVAESGCRYFAELAFPQPLRIGIRLEKLGTSSVVYELGVFGESGQAAAVGRWVHVYVDRETRKPSPIPAGVRSALESLQA